VEAGKRLEFRYASDDSARIDSNSAPWRAGAAPWTSGNARIIIAENMPPDDDRSSKRALRTGYMRH